MGNYFFTTLLNGATKLAPYIIFLLAGYFIFIKLPFLFFRKSMDHQKRRLQDENKSLKIIDEKYTVDDYMAFQKKVKEMNKEKEPKKAKVEQKAEQKKEAPKKPAPKQNSGPMPEEVFQFKPNETFTQSELKKRYFELLKQNHPDRVASMGQDFKILAEKNTKDINKAYEILKKKAS